MKSSIKGKRKRKMQLARRSISVRVHFLFIGWLAVCAGDGNN